MTTPMPPDPMHDDELPGEAELKASYARLPQPEPAPALDAAIRQAAARELRENIPPARRRPRWPIALGTAATLVLAAGLAWRVREAPTPSTAAPSPAALAADAQGARETVARDEAAEPPMRAGRASAMKAMTPAPTGAAVPQSLPLRYMPRTPTALAPASKRTATAPEADRVGNALPAIDRTAPAAAKVSEALEAPAPPAPPAPPPVEEMATHGAAQPAPAPLASPAPPAAPADLPAAKNAPAAMTSGQLFSVNAAATKEFDAIRALYTKGERTAAHQRLEAVRREHPDWPLPDDLRAHLDEAP